MATIGIIAGTGLAQGLEELFISINKYGPDETRKGVVLSHYAGKIGQHKVILIPRHGDSLETPSRSPAEMVRADANEAHIWLLYKAGVEAIYGVSAVGALDTDIPLVTEGAFVIPTGYVRGFAASQHSFGKDALEVHPNMGDPFHVELRVPLEFAVIKAGYRAITPATYIYNGGDNLESNDEIEFLNFMTHGRPGPPKRVVGMTTVPEAMLAAQMRIPYAAICAPTNYAQGKSQEVINHPLHVERMAAGREYLQKIFTELFAQMHL
ncbi:MAG: 5'-methylthioadenosine phosphorylase [Nanoarchaeota archaeon]